MAYYFIFPENDATIYSHPDRTKMNTGEDEILEIVKEKGSSDERTERFDSDTSSRRIEGFDFFWRSSWVYICDSETRSTADCF